MLIPSTYENGARSATSLSRRVNANSQLVDGIYDFVNKLIKKGEC